MNKSNIEFNINGQEIKATVYPMTRLLDVIREDAELTGTKEGCGEGECGACSIFFDGKLANSCLIPALQANGKTIETVESLASETALSKIQQAFLEHGGAQCGICTPGMLMAATELLQSNSSPNKLEIREALAGNLCRCTGYTKIFTSVIEALRDEK
jgi:aerobic carbon-monoxide dehydrogenase small subunit